MKSFSSKRPYYYESQIIKFIVSYIYIIPLTDDQCQDMPTKHGLVNRWAKAAYMAFILRHLRPPEIQPKLLGLYETIERNAFSRLRYIITLGVGI